MEAINLGKLNKVTIGIDQEKDEEDKDKKDDEQGEDKKEDDKKEDKDKKDDKKESEDKEDEEKTNDLFLDKVIVKADTEEEELVFNCKK